MTLSALPVEEKQVQAVAIEAACRRIAPLWPLRNFVAVNPFLGLAEMPFPEAARLLGTVAKGSVVMDSDYFLNQIRNGAIQAQHVQSALEQLGGQRAPADPLTWLTAELQREDNALRILTVADGLDAKRGSAWGSFVVDEISKWCASYFDCGQASWSMPWKGESLFQAWKRVAEIDANAEVAGLPGFRRHVQSLPDFEDAAIAHCLRLLKVPADTMVDFLHCELMSVPGWSAYAAYHDRQTPGSQLVKQVLAIRLVYDVALLSLDEMWRCKYTESAAAAGFSTARYIAQLAAEQAFRTNLVGKLHSVAPPSRTTARKQMQAVFCIDVRSEVYRRALEAQSPEIQTIGFAGFFGMPVAFKDSALCPVLLSPRHELDAKPRPSGFGDILTAATTAWKHLTKSASACFSSVEVGGVFLGAQMLRKAAASPSVATPAPLLTWDIPLSERVDLVAGALKNMSLDVSRLAPVVLICGHGSSTENNPYASSLDCGACGGHKGDVNARFAAALMNDREVREQLKARGVAIPEDTVFAAALHVTTTDDVILYDANLLTDKQRIEIEKWLSNASRLARAKRVGHSIPPSDKLDREARRRSADWSEVRPEWGLAGNAAFIAAPRTRTEKLDLGGRVFLHDYDSAADPDSSVLQLILIAPVVVASWINLQYYGSTVNNQLWGSGNKVLHNVAGKFGVWEGNAGDLRTGLPMQSLHDGSKWVHEPLRLQVFIDAPCERIEAILQANSDIRNLVDNNWIYLHSMAGASIYQRRGAHDWQLVGNA